MKMQEFTEKVKVESGQGFPQGDTVLIFEGLDIEKTDYEGKPRYKIVQGDKTFFAPPSLVSDLVKIFNSGVPKARVTRQGEGQRDTRYTVIGLNEQ